jgi:beta propeller repeat protein
MSGMLGLLSVALVVSSLTVFGLVAGVADAAVKKAEFPVSDTSSNKQRPSVGGSVVVWEDDRDGVSNIFAKNLATGRETLVATGVSVRGEPVTNGRFVAWEDGRRRHSDIYVKDIRDSASRERVIAGGPGDQRKPEISGSALIWESKNSSGKWAVYRHNLNSQSPPSSRPVITGSGIHTNPVISGSIVAWQAEVRRSDGTVTSNIFAKNLATGEVFHVRPSDSYQDQPEISGSIVVWRQEAVANYSIFGKDLYGLDLENGKVFEVTPQPAGTSADQVAPAISGTVVVWEDYRNGKAEVWARDLMSGSEFRVAVSNEPQTSPAISGETIVWESQYQGQPNFGRYDVHGAEVEAAPLTPAGLKAGGSMKGVTLRWARGTEGDLAGYNVYRGGSRKGSFTKLNAIPLDSPSFSDAKAPKGSVSFYRVTAVDALGNQSLPARADAAAVVRSSVSLSASPAVLKYGAATKLSGRLLAGGRPLSGKRVVLERRPSGADGFKAVSGGRLTTAADGTFRLAGLKPKKNTLYRVRYGGERGIRGSTASRRVNVKAKVSLSPPNIEKNKNEVSITGRVTTRKNGVVNLAVRRNGKVISKKTVPLVNSAYRSVYKPSRPGRYTVQATVPKTRTHLGNTVTRGFSAG